jgi:hypothetical protein
MAVARPKRHPRDKPGDDGICGPRCTGLNGPRRMDDERKCANAITPLKGDAVGLKDFMDT